MSKYREVQSKKLTAAESPHVSGEEVASQVTLSGTDGEEVDGTTGPQQDCNGSDSSGDDNDSHNMTPDVGAGKEEVKELCVLLDSTLHLPLADVQELPVSQFPPSGRLADRAQSLRL